MIKFATNVSGAILLPCWIQVTESISGSVVPLAMFLLKYLSLGKIWRWEPFMGQLFQKNLPKSPAHLFLHALFSCPVSSRHGWKRPVQGILRISIEGNSWCCTIFSFYFYNCFNRTPFFLVLYRPHVVEDDQPNDKSLDEDKCHRHRVKRASLSKLKSEKQACPNYLDEDDDEEADWWVDFNCRLH